MLLKVDDQLIEVCCSEFLASEFYKLKKLSGKWITKQIHIVFMKRCLSIKFIPVGLRINLPNVGFGDSILFEKKISLELKILQRTIGFYKKQQSEINKQRRVLVESLASNCDEFTWNVMRNCIICFENALGLKETNKKLKKEKKWGIFQVSEQSEVDLGKRVVNCSQEVLDDEKLKVLSLGCNFGITQVKNWKRNIMIDVENGLGRVDESAKTKIRSEIGHFLNADIRPQLNLSTSECQSLKEISRMDNILITKADKGGAVVILDKIDYEEKMLALVSGEDFSRIDKKRLNKSFKTVSDEIEHLIGIGAIEKKDRKLWKVTNPVVPPIRGFPKIHKPEAPLRPVVNCSDSCTEKASKKISKFLRDTSVLSPYTLKNSCDFVSKIKSIPRGNQHRIWASLDVVKLFPSVDRSRLWKIMDAREKDEKIFLGNWTKLTQICVEESLVTWKDEVFLQNKGLPIGSSLSPVLSEIYLSEWEEQYLSDKRVELVFWGRYVDDICICWEGTEESLVDFVQWANSKWEDIQFELVLQKDGELSFLDVNLTILDDGTVITTLFQKEVASGILLNEREALPHRTSENMIKNRFLSVAKFTDDFEKDSGVLRDQFLHNGHHLNKINRCLEWVNNKQSLNVANEPVEEPVAPQIIEKAPYVVMDYVGKINYKIERTLKRAGLRVVYRKGKRLECLTKNNKSCVEILDRKGLVYKISCEGCTKSYIGETGQPLKLRIEQHKRSVKTGDMNNAFFVHFKLTNHLPNWGSAEILEYESDTLRRKKIEAWYIQKWRDSLFNLYDGVKMNDLWGRDWCK